MTRTTHASFVLLHLLSFVLAGTTSRALVTAWVQVHPPLLQHRRRVATPTAAATALSLFGGGGAKSDGEKKQPGMMDQLAMLKKAQEMAQKKQKIDEELKKMTFTGTSADGKVTVIMSFVPTSNPMDPNPDYEATKFTFDDAFYAESSPEQIASACKEAMASAIANTNTVVAEKYNALSSDLMAALGQK